MNIKQQLYKHCQEFVNQKLDTIQKTILSNKEALNSETKSSAGDKHETGRAMLQLEMEKAGQQLKVVLHHSDGTTDDFMANQTYNENQIEWFKAGSALNLIKSQNS